MPSSASRGPSPMATDASPTGPRLAAPWRPRAPLRGPVAVPWRCPATPRHVRDARFHFVHTLPDRAFGWQGDCQHGPLARAAVQRHLPPVGRHDAAAYGKAQPRASLDELLGRKERVKDAFEVIRRDAIAIVPDSDPQSHRPAPRPAPKG